MSRGSSGSDEDDWEKELLKEVKFERGLDAIDTSRYHRERLAERRKKLHKADEPAANYRVKIPPNQVMELTKMDPTMSDRLLHYAKFAAQSRQLTDAELIPWAMDFDKKDPSLGVFSLADTTDFAMRSGMTALELRQKKHEKEIDEVHEFYAKIVWGLLNKIPNEQKSPEEPPFDLNQPAITLVQNSASTNPGGVVQILGMISGLSAAPNVFASGHPEGMSGSWEGKGWILTPTTNPNEPVRGEFGVLTLGIPTTCPTKQYPLKIRVEGTKAEASFELNVVEEQTNQVTSSDSTTASGPTSQ